MRTNIDVYDIYYDNQLGAVVMDWDGYSTSNQFKEGTELMLNMLILHHTHKVLADIKDMVLIGLEDQKWLESYFLPRAIKFGFKTIAIVRPDYYFNQVAIESISSRLDRKKLKLAAFDHVEDARAWLSAN